MQWSVCSWTMHRAAATLAAILSFLAAQVGSQTLLPVDLLLSDMDAGNTTGNTSSVCLSRSSSASCPDKDIHFYLYSGNNLESEEIDVSDPEWLKKSRYNPDLTTVMLIHGYRGGDSLLPMVVLKEAYIHRGTYNVITVDWGEFARPPCYIQAVGNMRFVSKCTGHMLSYLQDSGVVVQNITCIGHSLGAHVCGVLSNYAPQRMERIIGLDPARPLIQYSVAEGRLDKSDAKIVQVIHSNTGFYGLAGMVGTVDFCVNNGAQPYCKQTRNSQLCSHTHAVCYQAASLYHHKAARGYPCDSTCPNRNVTCEGDHILLGEHMESSALGMYCVTSPQPPYCRDEKVDKNYGDPRCCPNNK